MSAKPLYLSFKSAPARLHALRLAAEKSGKTWQQCREYGFHNRASAHGDFSQGYNPDGAKQVPVWVTFNAPCFRDEKYADESDAYRIDHTGRFCDEECDNKARGIIARLTHGRFIAGYELSVNGQRVYFGTVYTDERQAVIEADSYAESIADDEREYDEKYRAAQRLDDETESAVSRLRECLALRNNACFARRRSEARDLIETIRENRETLATDYKGVL